MRLLPPPIRGIGKECALLLAQQGFDIGITWHSDEEGAKDTAREVVSHGVRAEIVQLDLGKLPEGAQALEKLIQRLGRIDVLVNNAGAMTKAPFLDMAFDEWRKIFLPLMSMVHFLCSQIAARQMVKQGAGAVASSTLRRYMNIRRCRMPAPTQPLNMRSAG